MAPVSPPLAGSSVIDLEDFDRRNGGEVTQPKDAQGTQSAKASDQSPEFYNEMDLEKLGRARPDVFSNAWSETAFVFSIVMSQVLSVSY